MVYAIALISALILLFNLPPGPPEYFLVFAFLAGELSAPYALFPYFPSGSPPRIVFCRLRIFQAWSPFFKPFQIWRSSATMAFHSSVFPEAPPPCLPRHSPVRGRFSLRWPERKRYGTIVAIYAISVADRHGLRPVSLSRRMHSRVSPSAFLAFTALWLPNRAARRSLDR